MKKCSWWLLYPTFDKLSLANCFSPLKEDNMTYTLLTYKFSCEKSSSVNTTSKNVLLIIDSLIYCISYIPRYNSMFWPIMANILLFLQWFSIWNRTSISSICIYFTAAQLFNYIVFLHRRFTYLNILHLRWHTLLSFIQENIGHSRLYACICIQLFSTETIYMIKQF